MTWFRRGLPGKARDFNWHNVIGFWSAVPLFIVVLSATVISYPWASNLVYRLVGEVPPAQGGLRRTDVLAPRRPRQRSQGQHLEGELPRRSEGTPRGIETAISGTVGGREPRSPARTSLGWIRRSRVRLAGPPTDLNLDGFDRLWSRAEQQVAGWHSISLRLPGSANAPLAFTIDQGNGGQPQKRAQLTLNRATGEVVRWEPFSSLTLGRRLRMIFRFAHTGEVAGVIGQTIAGVVSAGATVLVYTGLALAWRRLRAWQVRRRSQGSVAVA